MKKGEGNSQRSETKETKPVTTYRNGELRVEGRGWYLEVKVLSSGRQIMIRCAGTVDGDSDLIVRPDSANTIFVSSRASEQEEAAEKETP